MTEANKRQVGGNHYRKMVLEHWDIVVLNSLDYFQGNITKYVMRWRDKGGIADLEKAKHYIEKYIEIEKARADGELSEELLNATLKALREEDADEPIDESLTTDPQEIIRRSAIWDKDRDTKNVSG